jgi:putative oxidoreductase
MFQKLIRTECDVTALILRLALGVVMFPHGAQKTLGLFGGPGFSGTMQFFTQSGIPTILAFLAIAAEGLGSLGLVVGLMGRVAAFGIACNMLVAMFMVHLPNGFFMNWFGSQKGEGFEYHILAIGIALAVMIKGSGAGSVDYALAKRAATPVG